MIKFAKKEDKEVFDHENDMVMARKEGMYARVDGLSINENPYIEGSDLWRMWQEGYMAEEVDL